MTEADKKVREYLTTIGRRGGIASRRDLTRHQAKMMVAIREAKRAAKKKVEPWPPHPGKPFTIPKAPKIAGRPLPKVRKRPF